MLSQRCEGAAEGKDGREITQEKPLAQVGCPASTPHISHNARSLEHVPLENTSTQIHSWQNQRSCSVVAFPALSVGANTGVCSPASLQGAVNGQRLCPAAGSAAGRRRFVKASPRSRSAHLSICLPCSPAEAQNQQCPWTRLSQPLLSLAEAQER